MTTRRTIKLGAVGDDVREWQSILGANPNFTKRGSIPYRDSRGPADLSRLWTSETAARVFGPATERATQNWQSDRALVPDGIVGPKTWGAASDSVAPPASPDSPVPEYRHPLYRPVRDTRLNAASAAAALRDAIIVVTGARPSREALRIIVAHSGLETGDWRKMRCFNFGNSKSSLQWVHTYFHTGERDSKTGKTVMFDPPHVRIDGETAKQREERVVQTRFRAFTTAAEGATHHLRLLTGGRYAPAYARALAGDLDGFSRELGRLGYYTSYGADPVQNYTRALQNRSADLNADAIAAAALEAP